MFFSSAGLGDGFHVGMIMGGVNCLFTFPGLYLVERVGRRKLLLWGACVQCASLFLVGICHVASKGKIPVLTAVFSGTFIAAFAASWGPCAWVITSELFGLKTRAKQMSFAVAGNWYVSLILLG
jgi:MFS transporter, SP family, sugar:H+ symporter